MVKYWNVDKFWENMCGLALFLLLIWVFISWGEIIMKNVLVNPQYSDFNFLVVLLRLFGCAV
jgi:hypothetical protein